MSWLENQDISIILVVVFVWFAAGLFAMQWISGTSLSRLIKFLLHCVISFPFVLFTIFVANQISAGVAKFFAGAFFLSLFFVSMRWAYYTWSHDIAANTLQDHKEKILAGKATIFGVPATEDPEFHLGNGRINACASVIIIFGTMLCLGYSVLSETSKKPHLPNELAASCVQRLADEAPAMERLNWNHVAAAQLCIDRAYSPYARK